MLFILSMLVACDECEIADMPKSAKKLGEIGNSSRLLLTRFGKNVSFVVPEFDSFSEIPLPYLYSVIGFGAPFVVMFIFMVLIFLFHQLFCWCCCCLPKRSKKPGCLAIVFHLIAMAACVASACMFFFASSSFTRALANVKHLPSATKKEFSGVFDTVDGVLDKTFTLVHGVMNHTASNLTAFVDWIVTENKKCQGYCKDIDTVMDAYKESFSNPNGNFQKPYQKIGGALQACNPSEQQRNAWVAMYGSVDAGVKTVHKVTEQLTKATDSINKNAENIRGTINGSLKEVNKKISEYENGGLRDTIKGFRTQIDSLIDKTKPAEEGIEKYDKYINLSTYIGTCFLAVVTVILGLFFFCNNCCSRCVACCFPLFGLFLTVLIVLPGVAFAAVFYIFYDVCPVLEQKAGGLLKDYLEPKSVEDVLLCPVAKPLLDSINLGFNYRDVIKELSTQASSALKAFDIPPEMKEELKDFAKDFTVKDQMSSDYLVWENSVTIPKTQEFINNGCKPKPQVTDRDFTDLKRAIDSEDDKLDTARVKMDNIVFFGGSIIGESEKRRTQVVGLVETFIADATTVIEGGINSITCQTSKCIYAPVKNAICVNFLDGICFWIFSSVLMAIGIFVMECGYCCRRRNMKNPHTSHSSSSQAETSSDSLDDFQPQQRKKNKHHH